MTRRRIGFVTAAHLANLHEDDRLLLEPLARRGIDVVPIIWSEDQTPAEDLELLVVRSTWDYTERLAEFQTWLGTLNARRANVHNEVALVRWNIDKRYLLDLQSRGIRIIPSIIVTAKERAHVGDILRERGWDDAIVKPTVSASAKGLHRFARDKWSHVAQLLASDERDMLIQPFDGRVETNGELSFIFFNGEFSHAVRKRPPPGDFRAQEHLGGTTTLEPSPNADAIDAARSALHACGFEVPLYARVDLLEGDGGLLLMELELVEPLLYLGWAPGAADKFTEAIAMRLVGVTAGG